MLERLQGIMDISEDTKVHYAIVKLQSVSSKTGSKFDFMYAVTVKDKVIAENQYGSWIMKNNISCEAFRDNHLFAHILPIPVVDDIYGVIEQ
jgi:hypothetical protein